MGITLFEIGDEMDALDRLLDEADGDATDYIAIVEDWLAEIDISLDGKLDNYAALISQFEAKAKARKAEAARMAALAKTDQNKADALRSRLKAFFEVNGIKKRETARYKITIAKNGGVAPLIFEDEEEFCMSYGLDTGFVESRYKPASKAVREAIVRGDDLDGVRIGERGTSLRIK